MESLSKAIPFTVLLLSTLCRSSQHVTLESICISIQIHPPLFFNYWVKYSSACTKSCTLLLHCFSEVLLVLCLPMSPCRLLSENHVLLFHFAISCFLKNAFSFLLEKLNAVDKKVFLHLSTKTAPPQLHIQ